MQYYILLTALIMMLGFAFSFQLIMRNDIRQYYMTGVGICYVICTLVRRIPAISRFFDKVSDGLSVILFCFFLFLSIICAVGYMMQFLRSAVFRYGAGIFMTLEFILFCCSVALWLYGRTSYDEIFLVGTFILGLTALIFSLYFFVRAWNEISTYHTILLIATYSMIALLMISVILNLTENQYVYTCSIGIFAYLAVYITVSFMELRHRSAMKAKPALADGGNVINDDNTADQSNPFAKLSNRVKQILDIMCEHNIVGTKDILHYLPDSATENSVNITLFRLMKETQTDSRELLIEKYKNSLT